MTTTLADDQSAVSSWWADKVSQVESILSQNGVMAQQWSYSLLPDGGAVQNAAELDQTIKIILSTPLGEDIHRPDFASTIFSFIDWPQNQVSNKVVAAATAALRKWEKRIEVSGIEVQPYTDPDGLTNAAHMQVGVTWTLEGYQGRTEVVV